MKRRTFLKIAGAGSLSFVAGCNTDPEKTLYSLVEAPDDMVTGSAAWYASTCRECPAGCGVLAKNREGRIIKLEGNPRHPVNRGRLCMRGQAALQGLYNPDRITTPLVKEKNRWMPITFARAEGLLRLKTAGAAGRGGNRIRMISEVIGESQAALFTRWLQKNSGSAPLFFETFAYESLKTANEKVLGVAGLPSYRIDHADMLLSFGTDFLETWLSPVEYAGQFKAMHAYQKGRKGRFYAVSPFQSLTAANADRWIGCRPGSEAIAAAGLLRHTLQSGRGQHLPTEVLTTVKKAVAPFTREKVVQQTNVPADAFEELASSLLNARTPLVLGNGNGGTASGGLATEMAANLLNRVLDPEMKCINFNARHRVETAARRSEVIDFFHRLQQEPADLLLVNNANPVFALPPGSGVRRAMKRKDLYVVSFSNFMDETTAMADLIYPVGLPLETWDEYGGRSDVIATMQPAMGRWNQVPDIGDLFLKMDTPGDPATPDYKHYLYGRMKKTRRVANEKEWLLAIQRGGIFKTASSKQDAGPGEMDADAVAGAFQNLSPEMDKGLQLMAVPSIRFFDGRGANRPWLCEIPDPVTKVAWQTPVLVHPKTAAARGWSHKQLIAVSSGSNRVRAPVYEYSGVHPGLLVISIGQGHTGFGRYANGKGVNPLALLPPLTDTVSGAPVWATAKISVAAAGGITALAHTDGSRSQHRRKIALSVTLEELAHDTEHHDAAGLTMDTFPVTLPLPEGYDPGRDIYPPHDHDGYRWGMVIDLDRCIGCGACSAACYAENNLGVVGEERILEGREMSWMRVERYHRSEEPGKLVFLPMLCQHCDNAPCESVCPVYAPHHSKEGLNNQIYNRCIGTRFCSQNCPYKVRRFNWYTWAWPKPLNLQLNPNVTVRSKGVMEKCSFCIQRIKEAHGVAKNQGRKIRDGEIEPACLQTCPTGAITFGDLMDKSNRVRQMVADPRTYQVMGYLNTKPAVFYQKKVVLETEKAGKEAHHS